MRNPKFKNKNGTLTAYAFACGYVQEWFDGERYATSTLRVTLSYENGAYHLKSFNENCTNGSTSQDWNDPNGWRFWSVHDTLTEAKKAYYNKVREFKKIATG